MKRPSPKILVICEDESVQKALEARLILEGCRVMQAYTWNKAVDCFSSEKSDAVILDLDFGRNSSQINGVDLIHFMKKSRNYPAPLIVYGDPTDRITGGFYADATTFVPKSSPIGEIVAILMGTLGDPGTDSSAYAGAIS